MKDSEFRQYHRPEWPATVYSDIFRNSECLLHNCHAILDHRPNYCNRYCPEPWPVTAVVRCHLQTLCSNKNLVKLKTKKKTKQKNLLIEFRLLLSPDKECVSAAPMANAWTLDVGVSVLVGRDSRRSRSTSERSGRLGVNCMVEIRM